MTDSDPDRAIGQEQHTGMISGAGFSYQPGRRRRPELAALRMMLSEQSRRTRAAG